MYSTNQIVDLKGITEDQRLAIVNLIQTNGGKIYKDSSILRPIRGEGFGPGYVLRFDGAEWIAVSRKGYQTTSVSAFLQPPLSLKNAIDQGICYEETYTSELGAIILFPTGIYVQGKGTFIPLHSTGIL